MLALAGDAPKVTALGNVKVLGKIVAQGKDDKLIVFKFRRRKRYKRKMGHRQRYTEIEITSVPS